MSPDGGPFGKGPITAGEGATGTGGPKMYGRKYPEHGLPYGK
jgi:hypothetical protein